MMSEVHLERADDWSYDILVDGQAVGYIEGRADYLGQIDIQPEHRGNGYGKAAVRQFVEQARHAGAESVETSAVVSSAMESIVMSLGFERVETDESHWVLSL